MANRRRVKPTFITESIGQIWKKDVKIDWKSIFLMRSLLKTASNLFIEYYGRIPMKSCLVLLIAIHMGDIKLWHATRRSIKEPSIAALMKCFSQFQYIIAQECKKQNHHFR